VAAAAVEVGGGGTKSFRRAPAAVHHARQIDMGDNTQLIRVRQSAGRHKVTLVICALLVLGGFVGWLTTL
jgi:hypothetical protein